MDFSDSIGGTKRAYRTRNSRRRRKRGLENEEEEVGDLSDSEEETLATKLARLKREAEEVRLELERRELGKNDDAELEDSLEQQQQRKDHEEDVDVDGVHELNRILDGLSTKARLKTAGTVEDEFISRLTPNPQPPRPRQQQEGGNGAGQSTNTDTAASTNLSAVAEFSDRLTALESALGISSTSAASRNSPIIPTLSSLSAQITTLSATLTPQSLHSGTTQSQPNTTYLDTISSKLKALISESDRLIQSRKQAQASLVDLHEKRMNQLVSGATVQGNTRSSRLRGLSATSGTANPQSNNEHRIDASTGPGEESLQIQSQLFLDEQASKITALYHLLPSIQDLQPLLPVVLERLRTLSVLHNGAAQAKELVDDLEGRQRETREELARWREAVEHVEAGMKEAEEIMESNVDVLGTRVREVEERVGRLGSDR